MCVHHDSAPRGNSSKVILNDVDVHVTLTRNPNHWLVLSSQGRQMNETQHDWLSIHCFVTYFHHLMSFTSPSHDTSAAGLTLNFRLTPHLHLIPWGADTNSARQQTNEQFCRKEQY